MFFPAHFALSEFEHAASIPDVYLGNAAALANLLERMRAAGGDVPMVITSGYRPASVNAAVGGVSDSQHITASAADVRRIGLDSVEWSRKVVAAKSSAGPWGQLLLYPHTDGHLHISIPGRHTNYIGVEVGKNADGSSRFATWDGVGAVPPWGSGFITGAALPDAPTNEGGAYVSVTTWLVILGVVLFGLSLLARGSR